jgi:hypothetical protein
MTLVEPMAPRSLKGGITTPREAVVGDEMRRGGGIVWRHRVVRHGRRRHSRARSPSPHRGQRDGLSGRGNESGAATWQNPKLAKPGCRHGDLRWTATAARGLCHSTIPSRTTKRTSLRDPWPGKRLRDRFTAARACHPANPVLLASPPSVCDRCPRSEHLDLGAGSYHRGVAVG